MPKDIVIYITLIIIALILYNVIYGAGADVSVVLSDIDQREYVVLNLPDRKIAADQLANIRIKLEDFIRYLENANGEDPAGAVTRIKTRYQAVLSENTPNSDYTSYTLNKGSEIHMCLRERDENNKLIDENTLFFVALHELAHIMTVSMNHTEEFWTNFRYLLRHAIEGGYYKYHPYHNVPKKYCGTYITDTPLKL